MNNLTLTELELRDLLNLYKSEMNKLIFQYEKTSETVKALESAIERVSKKDLARSERSVKLSFQTDISKSKITNDLSNQPQKKSGKKRRRRATGGYRLNSWDKLIIKNLEESDEPLDSNDMNAIAIDYAREKGMKISESEISGKISRSIHKLANKRNIIKKLKKEGRGNNYILV